MTPYRWYINPPTHDISTPLPMVFWPPYPWYIDPLTHGILTPPIHGILTPLPMVYWTPYPWYIDPHIHGISTPISMVFWPPTHDILTSLHIFWLEMGGSKYHGGSIYHTGGVQIYHGCKSTPGSIYHGVQNTIWHRHLKPIVIFFCPHIMTFKSCTFNIETAISLK